MHIVHLMNIREGQKKGVIFKYFELPAGDTLEKDSYARNNYLIFNLEGTMKYVYNGLKPQLFSAGNIIFLASQTNCMLTSDTKVRLLVIEFDELYSLCDKFTFQALSPIQSLLQYDFETLDIRYPLNEFLELQIEYLKDQMESEYLMEEKLKEVFIIFRAYYSKEELSMFFYPLIAKSVDFKNMVLANYRGNMRLEELAEACFYSKRVFQRRFKEIFGESPEQWILKEKSKQIRHYLSTSDISFKEIVEKLGFDSAVHLNKFCKTWFGMSPTELRQTLLLQKEIKE